MRMLVISDLRGKTERVPQVAGLIQHERIGAVVFCGNIVSEDIRSEEFEKSQQTGQPLMIERTLLDELEAADVRAYEAFFDEMGKFEIPVMVVPGYLDAPERLYLQAALNHEVVMPNVHMVHRSFTILPGEDLALAGFGGRISDGPRENRFVLYYPDWEARFALDFVRELDQELALVFHNPPRHGELDLEDGTHVGHEVIDTIIKTYHPRFAFCGGALDGQGTTHIGPTLVVNPGPLRDGHYAILDTKTKDVSFGQLPAV